MCGCYELLAQRTKIKETPGRSSVFIYSSFQAIDGGRLSYAVSMAAASSSKSAKSKQSPYSAHPAFSRMKAGSEHNDPEALVDGIFLGQKSSLRPIYEEILQFALELAPDTKVCPCATIIPFYRKHVIAQVKAPNRSRIDLGFALGDMKAIGALIDTGGFAKKDRITHRMEIASPEQFNEEAKKWFRRAYDMDAR